MLRESCSFFAVALSLVVVGLAGCATKPPALPQLAPGVYGQVYRPAGDGPFPALVYLHGSGGMRPAYHEEAQFAAEHGYVALVLDYYAENPFRLDFTEGQRRRWLAWRESVVAAARYLGDLPEVDEDRLALVGFSQGAAVAIAAAHEIPHLRGIVDFFGPNVESWYVSWFLKNKDTMPANYLDLLPPVLIIHGSADPIVPESDSKRLYEALAARGKDVELHIYPGSLHALNDPISDSPRAEQVAEDARQRAIRFLDRVMRELASAPEPDIHTMRFSP